MKTAPKSEPHDDTITPITEKTSPVATDDGAAISPGLYELIKQQPFFKGLNQQQLQLLTESAMRMNFDPGQAILEEGSPANRFYLILDGAVALESEIKDHRKITIQTLGPGDDLGWSWLFPPFYVHFGARALTPTKTIFFYGTRLREQCEKDHELGYQLMTRIAEVVIQCLKATQLRLAECTDTH